jgi:hypothetical protein
MKNYTEQLKKYWKTESLSFIAVFTKFKVKEGFFNDFINPESLIKTNYPEFDNIKINQKKVSFYIPNASKFIDGHYYKVDLQHTDNPKGKDNPYSLQIKSVSELDQNKIEKLLSKKNQEVATDIKYIGMYYKTSESFACFENVMVAETGEILMFQGESQKVYASPNLDLKQGSYYQFSCNENEGKLPSALIKTIQPTNNPYSELIEERFRLHNNPASNKANAKTMREIGIGMYSSKERMIYELLQNADDSPGKDRVEFHIDINGDYFFIMHDGASFDKNDVKAITSAGESTKEKSKNKTGYKGIGFKSVFTNSTEVWIKSGGYQFAFLKNSQKFNDFDSLYFPDERRAQFTDEGLRIEQDRFLEQKEGYDSTLHVPWQLMPIWQEQLPQDFDDANFDRFNNPVQIALRLGKNNIEDYKLAIDNITKRPQFLLFLRNTSKFNSRKNGVMVLRNDHNNVIEILRVKGEVNEIYHYTKQIFNNIEVSDEAFQQLGIGLKKKSEFNENTKAVNNYFVDLDENRLDEIPPKLASVDQTEITFAIKIENQKIVSEEGYLNNSQNYSSLFTYLPMEDKRLILPFLVNADFVPDSRRENLQYGNPWNKYIMIKVAEKHVATLAYFAKEFLKDNVANSSYLSLLLKNPLPEDDTAQQIIDSYNITYLEQLENTEIVINDNNQIQLLSDTIIDDSGLTELFGNEIFYEIIDTKKRLPHPNLDTKYLKDYEYLNVEAIDLKELAEQIIAELCESLGYIIDQSILYEKPELLKWLNKLVKHIPEYFGKIPFIVHNSTLFSLERLIDEEDAWLINEHTSQYSTLIEELGYHTIQLNLDKYSNIKEYLHSFSGYINDKTLAYERIASNSNINKLPIASKLKLIDFFQNSSFMVGIGNGKYFGELKLFIDEEDNPRSLSQLLSRKEDLEVDSIYKYRIKENEYNSIPEALKKELIAKDEIFTSFILDEDLFKEWSQQFDNNNINIYVSDLKTIYSWIGNPDEISSADWASIPWLYIDAVTRFETSDKVYWSKAFKELSDDKYQTIKSVLHNEEIKTLPVQECGSLINAFPIKTDDSSELDWSKVEELEMLVANTLLDWMEDDGGFGDFFKTYTLVANSSGNYKIEEIEDVKIFDGTDKALKNYIQSNTELSSIFNELNKNLCSENRSLIGLLQGDRLINALIGSSKYDQNLALHLPINVSTELLHSFITNLKEFKLLTASEYGVDTPEHFIISRLLKSVESINEIPTELQSTINILRGKTTIDGNPLSNYTVSDRVSFGTIEERKVLKLSDILTEFQGESDVLDNVKESFTAITQRAKLRELIFKTIPLTPAEIHTKIESENNIHYTVYQVVFQLLDKKYGGGKRHWSKQRFDEYFIEQGSEAQLHNSYSEFLDALIELPFIEISDFTFQNLSLNNSVDKNFAIESECIPNWLEEWANKDQVKRLEFLSELGYNGTDSAIVNLRKFMIAKEYDQNSVIIYFEESKPNMQIIWNTVLWLANYNPNIVTQNIIVIKQVNDYIRFKPESIEKITVPIIKSIDAEGHRVYNLQTVNSETELLKINVKSEFSDSIFSSLNSSLDNPNCIDESIGKLSDYLTITAVQLEESVDLKSLESKSKLWEEPFYNKWAHKSEYPIYIYDGNEIPYKRSFNNIIINTFTQDLKVAIDGVFYVSSLLKNDPLDHLPGSFPKDKLMELKEWERRTLKEPSLIEDNPLEEKYNETFDRMIQNRYGISEEKQNDENSNAKKQALYYLDGIGYDVNDGHSKSDYAAIYNVKDPEGSNVNFIVKSARGGLLFLNKSHWEMLGIENTQLIAIYPGNRPKIFKHRIELLEDEMQDKVLFRIPNNKIEQEIDGVFDNLDSDSHLILVTSEKMKESLFDKIGKKGTFNKDEVASVMDDNIVIE